MKLDEARLKRQMRESGADLQGLLTRNTPQARQILRKLLDGKIRCAPTENEGTRMYQVSGQSSYSHLLPPTLALPLKVASPTGIHHSCKLDFTFTFNLFVSAA